MKKIYIIAAAIVTVASAGVTGAIAIGGGRPLSEMKGNVHQLIWSPEVASRAAEREKKGADQTATSTDLSSIPKSGKPELPNVTSYTEVASTSQSGKLDKHVTVDNLLKKVSFCGTSHTTRQIIINGVDVAQRIAYLASNDLMGRAVNDVSIGKVVCGNMRTTEYTQGILFAEDVATMGVDGKPLGNNEYWVRIGAELFAINPNTNEIFIIEGFDGSRIGPIGKLK